MQYLGKTNLFCKFFVITCIAIDLKENGKMKSVHQVATFYKFVDLCSRICHTKRVHYYFLITMTQFNFPSNLADDLQDEIYTKLVASVQQDVDKYNKMWSEREQAGKTYHTETYIRRGKEYSEKVYWYKLTKGLLDVKFFQEDSYGQMANDYYRPFYCTVHTGRCHDQARAQRDHAVALCEQRVNGHLATTDQISSQSFKLGKANLINGIVSGKTATGEDFQIHLQMMWNYRYGENSANGYMTQYVQYRSDRRGARQEGKSVQQSITDAEKQAKRDAKQAIIDQKNLAKWEKFQKLPVQMEKWIDKEIKKLAEIISPEGLALIKATADHMNYEFNDEDREWKIKCVSKDIELHNTLRNDLRHWQNDETGLKALFDKGVDTRNKLKEMYGV